jgi:hypothetical protein
MHRVFAFAKITRSLTGMRKQKQVSKTSARLLKGFYTSNKFELGNESENQERKVLENLDFTKANTVISRL